MKDHSSKIVHLAARILEASKIATEKAEPYLLETEERPEIANELLIILNSADDLMEIFDPSKETVEYFGMPRESAMIEDEEELKFTNAAGWDFKAWYCEKTLLIKKSVKRSIIYWEKEIDEIELRHDAPMASRKWINSGLLEGLFQVERNAQKIFDMTFQDKIDVIKKD